MQTRFYSVLLLVAAVQGLLQIPLRQQFRPLDVGPASSTGTLRNFAGVQFYGDVAAGTPGQTIPALFDTGSYETWFPTTTYCRSMANACKSAGFDPSKSNTFQQSSNPFSVNYLSSTVSGVYGQDYVKFEQLSTNSIINIGLIESQSGFPQQSAFDGLVGMGPNSSFVQSTLDKAVADGKGERRMFSFYLSDGADSGSLTIGGFDESHIAGSANSSMVWFPSFPTTSAWSMPYWMLPSLTVAFDGTTVSTNTAVVIDSGTSFIIGPQDAVAEIYQRAGNVDSSGAIECWRVLSLPILSITIGNQQYDLKPEQYAYRGDDKYTCHIGITAFSDKSMWILGDVFMLNFLSVFSLEDPVTPADAVRDATLPRDPGPRQVRHWIGLGPVSPPRNVQFPSPTWFNSLAFYRIMIILIVVGILAALALIGRYVGRHLSRAFRRLPGGANNVNANARYLGNQHRNEPAVVVR